MYIGHKTFCDKRVVALECDRVFDGREPKWRSGTLSCLLSEGKSAKSCIENVTVANTCHEEGRREAKQTDAKIDALSEADLETL